MGRVVEHIGLMAGTFDPPHLGHLILAQLALTQLSLQQVRFLPVGQPTHKTTLTPAKHRIKMTHLSIESNQKFFLDLTDVERRGPHYTSTLLPLLQAANPQAKLTLLIGSDSLATFGEWHRPAAILDQCRLAVLQRPGYEIDFERLEHSIRLDQPTAEKREHQNQNLKSVRNQIDWLKGPSISISSTSIRQTIENRESVRYLITDDVITYINRHGLYAR